MPIADLPSIPIGKSINNEFGLENSTGAKFVSAGHVRGRNDQHDHLPEVTTNRPKRNSDGQVLQVKFAQNMIIPNYEKVKTVVPGFDSTINVDHKHYEQWARVPGRRVPNSTLLRGIQQLKSRMKRESMEQERYEAVAYNKDFHINQLTRNNLLTRDKMSDDNSINIRREKSNISTSSYGLRAQIPPRSPMKTCAQVIDSSLLRTENHDPDGSDFSDNTKDAESRTERYLENYSTKPRHAVSKTRDKCALPVSVYQPISIGEHVFLVNEPIKYTDFMKMKKTEYRIKKDPKSATTIIMPDRGGKVVHLPDPIGQYDANFDKKDPLNDSFQRTKTFAGGFPPSRTHKRTPVMVASAELFDFSQQSELRSFLDEKSFERSKTELSFPSNRSGRYSKWVPNVQRHKDVIK